jgi:hypothetical protein
MKRFTVVLAAVTLVLAGTSCTKSRTCTCTNGVDTDTYTVTTTKKKAKDFCSAQEAAYYTGGYSCSLD